VRALVERAHGAGGGRQRLVSRPLFWGGLALTGGVLLAMTADFAGRAAPVRVPVLPAPEGFRMNLKGVGPVEVAFTGRVELVTDEREEAAGGAARRVPRWKVNGSDPLPEGAGMTITDTHIEALRLDESGAPQLIANAPSAWIPLTRERGLLTLDLDRAWRMADPVLDLPGFRPGSRMTARATGMTELRPREESIHARGPFRLSAENLELNAAGFAYDAPRGRVRFEPWQGEVSWSFTDALGRTMKGSSDAGGEVVPLEGGGLLLRFDEGPRGVRSSLPAGKDLPPASMLARSLDLHFAQGGDGSWQPRSASARGPLLLTDARLAFEGGGAEIAWSPADGTLLEARIAGPLAVHPWEPPLLSATARESAIYDAARGTLTLDGRAWMADARGFLAADALRWDGADLHAAGSVLAHGAQGTALAERATASETAGLAASGGVRMLPVRGLVEELSGPSLKIAPDGIAELSDGFHARGRRDGIPWELSGRQLRQWQEEDGSRRAEALGDLVWSEPGLRLSGERFKQLDERRFRFEGAPARVWTLLESGAEAEASFRRADYETEGLHVEGEPWLRIPAAELGLAGEPVEIRARTAQRDHATGAWTLDGSVRVSGAMRTEVDRAMWSPAAGLRMERELAPPVVEGTLAIGTEFWLTAKEFGIDAERVLRLAGEVQGRFVEPDASEHRFWAERLEASEFGGIAEYDARVESPFGRGRADRLEWKTHAGELSWLSATGTAHLEREDLIAEGQRIEADQETGWVEAEGTSAQPAWARLPDGREVRAVWLRYNSRSHLVESGPVRLVTPAQPR
jgi:hypothetical protein